MRYAVLTFALDLEPGERKPIELDASGIFFAERLWFAGAWSQWEMVRSWTRKSWINRLVAHGPPVDVLDIKVDSVDVLASAAIPASMFVYEDGPLLRLPPANRFTLVVRNVSEKLYRLRGVLEGKISS